MTTLLGAAPRLAQLHDLSLDLRSSWRPEIPSLFRSIDSDGRLTGATDPWTILRLAPPASLRRLVAEHVEHHYLAAADRARALAAHIGAVATKLAASRARIRTGWDSIAIGPTEVRGRGHATRVVVPVRLGALDPADVAVQLDREPVLPGETDAVALPMTSGWRSRSGWTECGVAYDEPSAPLDAQTARALLREVVEHGSLALPLIAWQR